jgi:hypothetical protein
VPGEQRQIRGPATVHGRDVPEGDLDQSGIGFSDACLTTAAQINILVEPGSPFRAVRVGEAEDIDHNGNPSCAEIGVDASALFGAYWGG